MPLDSVQDSDVYGKFSEKLRKLEMLQFLAWATEKKKLYKD